MRRIHIGLNVTDLQRSVTFYSNLFGAAPSVVKDDYAKWMLEDPRVNFSISQRCQADVHFGIQVENEAELAETAGRLREAGERVLDEPETTCCYHHSDKAWVADPQHFLWETFLTHGEATRYGEDTAGIEELRCCV